MKRVLVAGGAGFVGSHLCEALLRGPCVVHVLDNLSSGCEQNIPQGAIFDGPVDVARHIGSHPRYDIIYNLASPASPKDYEAHPIQTMLTNANGADTLLEMATVHRAVYVQASTSEVYGDPQEHPQREEYWGHVNPVGVRSQYDEAKRYAEALCFAYHREHGTNVRLVRIFNTYGPRMRVNDGRVVPNFISQALAGEPLTMHGDGQQTRSLCYVDDTVEALVRVAQRAPHPERIMNVGNPGEITMNELGQRIWALCRPGEEMRVEALPMPGDDPKRRCPDISRASSHLDWRPETDLEVGLGRTIEWFRSQKA